MILKNKLNNRKIKFFLTYCLIGILSIILELLIRKLLININLYFNIFAIIPLFIGIVFAFLCNIKFNFKIPRYYYKISFLYFTIISISSFTVQFFASKIPIFQNFNYEFSRFFISGFVFFIAYYFHIKYSFSRNKKVGVAIYLDKNHQIDEIFQKVEFYPDYIHIDFVDRTMNENVSDADFNKLVEVKKKWPNHRIESHIMSKNPLNYIEKFSKFSDVIYFHNEINEDHNEVIKLIKRHNVKPGLVLHACHPYQNLEKLIDGYDEILVLCIQKPGVSGQNFLINSNNLITKINRLKKRSNFNLCVDGGLSDKNINFIECEKIVSSSSVIKNINPKKQIISLQRLLNN